MNIFLRPLVALTFTVLLSTMGYMTNMYFIEGDLMMQNIYSLSALVSILVGSFALRENNHVEQTSITWSMTVDVKE